MGEPDLSRRERRKLEVRHRILESALDLFRGRGFADTKISEICERADVAHKTFFNHFPSKQDLVREIAQHSIGELLIDIETARKAGANTADRLAPSSPAWRSAASRRGRCSARW